MTLIFNCMLIITIINISRLDFSLVSLLPILRYLNLNIFERLSLHLSSPFASSMLLQNTNLSTLLLNLQIFNASPLPVEGDLKLFGKAYKALYNLFQNYLLILTPAITYSYIPSDHQTLKGMLCCYHIPRSTQNVLSIQKVILYLLLLMGPY